MLSKPLEPFETFFSAFKGGSRPLSILDIGCGAGTNTLWLARQGHRVFGFDSSAAAISRLLSVLGGERFQFVPSVVIADVTKPWPYCDHSFDIAFEVRVFENLDFDEATFAYEQTARKLRHDGIFFCLTASEHRSDDYTTCGKVRKSSDMDLHKWLTKCGLQLIDKPKIVFAGTLQDWCLIAKRV
jgi:SAM-dependent methyltransferase